MKHFIYIVLTFLLISCADKTKETQQREVLIQETANSNYNPEAKLNSLGIELRDQGVPIANYQHVVRAGNLLFLAGKGPKQANGEYMIGKLGDSLTVEQGYQAAREAGINQLSVLKAELGNLNKVKRIVSAHGMVNASPDFTDHSKVINGFSDLMVEVFGENGKHARAAVGMVSLPVGMAVEIEMVVEVYE
ncbi:Enamine deaminase RidA, house cleaning of reactive enamine intermediates, YjgF/YER057c/UK114 family [Maribacter dokdonensis]|uniref:Enamine deaminase RidA, house cleaning of reactive enamine intermediates, YjgF/YER057c/UK114 family n=1 Tax=Maribacter dokdonensis TaxID=320912 RepID=A0ABY0UVH6_9FLAO|nr:RidA family protein [Maribacter dokdonensis]SDT24300.1 Enamine deaminase RidA, house cleaning of reactive enamine intermediates, YjgF/YER057c/UK114 family [Maribacter dokdonensis]